MSLFSSSDIEKYLSGELSDPEMHAMERAALDDPFLADALEGMIIHRSLPEQPSFREDMTSLEKRLDDRVSRSKRRPLLLPLAVRYAAAVILLLGIGITAWYALTDRKMKTAPLAKSDVEVPASKVEVPTVQQAPVPPATASAATVADSTRMALADGETNQLEAESLKKDVAANNVRKAKKYRIPDSLHLSSAGLTTNYSTSGNNQDAALNKNNFSALSKQPAAPQANNAAGNLANGPLNNNPRAILSDSLFARRDDSRPVVLRGVASGVAVQKDGRLELQKKSADQLVFTGKVFNQQKTPLAGATLSFKKGQDYVKTTTDANGFFTLKLPKYDSTSRTVAVNYMGYEPGYMTLNTDDKTGNVILLKPQQASLNEVVVVGYGSKRREFMRTDINSVPLPLSETAVPADGWPAYTNYLELNKNSSQIDTTIRGYESISFIVNKEGALSHFKVERSLSPAHDSLAIRLVKEGPSWKLLKGKKEKARVILTW